MPAMQSKNYAPPAEQTNTTTNENRAGYEYEPIEPQKFYLRRAHPRDPVEAVVLLNGKQIVLKLTARMLEALARDSTALHFSTSASWSEMWDKPFHRPELL